MADNTKQLAFAMLTLLVFIPRGSGFRMSEQRVLVHTARNHFKFTTNRISTTTTCWSSSQQVEQQQNEAEDILIAAYNKRVPIGSTPEFAIAGDSTVETPSQRLLLAIHFALASFNLALVASTLTINSSADVIKAAVVFALSIIVGDFGTGVFHWSVDNYGSINTPVFGTVCAAFQGHHVTPWTITFRSFANNVYKICYGTIPALLLISFSSIGPLTRMFLSCFVTWWMISQELHKYSHMRTIPPTVKTLQNMGIILSKKEHGLHHTSPFEGHYCILTGICNPWLDRINFFRYMESIVFKLTGNKANTWKEDPAVEELSRKLLPLS